MPAWVLGAAGQALRWALLPLAAAGTIAGVGIATGGIGSTAVMAAIADPLSVLAARSPGARPGGALTQTKPRKAPLAEERVLSNVLTRPDAPGVPGIAPAPVGDTVTDAVADVAPPAAVPPTQLAFGGPPVGGVIGTPGGIVVTPDGGGGTGGGGGGGGTTPPTTTPPVVVPSIPEPATWGMLLFGFGVIGGALRARRRAMLVPAKARASRG